MPDAPEQPVRVLLALGANLGEREARVLEAVREIERAVGRVDALSSLWESPAVDMGPAPPFVNAVVRVLALLSPGDLLERVQTVERRLGRTGGHNRPREIDVDVVAYGRRVIDRPELRVPHPRARERLFVLVPLAEIEPAWRCPSTGEPLEAWIRAARERGAVEPVRIARRWWTEDEAR